MLGADWTKLEDNIMGEFGWKEVLKQFLGEDKSDTRFVRPGMATATSCMSRRKPSGFC